MHEAHGPGGAAAIAIRGSLCVALAYSAGALITMDLNALTSRGAATPEMVTPAKRRLLKGRIKTAKRLRAQATWQARSSAWQQLTRQLPTNQQPATASSPPPPLRAHPPDPPPHQQGCGIPGLVIDPAHEDLVLCGGYVGCRRCGAIASTSAKGALWRPCRRTCPPGAERPVQRLQKGKLPRSGAEWPSGEDDPRPKQLRHT